MEELPKLINLQLHDKSPYFFVPLNKRILGFESLEELLIRGVSKVPAVVFRFHRGGLVLLFLLNDCLCIFFIK